MAKKSFNILSRMASISLAAVMKDGDASEVIVMVKMVIVIVVMDISKNLEQDSLHIAGRPNYSKSFITNLAKSFYSAY